MKRFIRPRFSIRTLAIFVTLVCAYFASWPLTEKYGVPKTTIYDDYSGGSVIWGASSPAPFIVAQDEIMLPASLTNRSPIAPGQSGISVMRGFSNTQKVQKRRYYLWLLKTKIRLPYQSEWQY